MMGRCKKCNSVPPKDFEKFLNEAGMKIEEVGEWQHKDCYSDKPLMSSKQIVIKEGRL